jgi:DNA-binding NtrC family response regulator
VLVVGNDDEYEQVLRTTMGRLRLHSNLETAFLHTLADARRVLGNARVDVVLSDFLLPDGTSAELFKELEQHSPDSHGVLLTGRPVEEFAKESDTSAPEVWTKAQTQSELRRNMERLILMRDLSRRPSRTQLL